MTISVIVPTYNRAALLPATLERILAQSTAPAQVVVIDDGSTDETAALMADRYAAVDYVRIDNAGASIARFEGVCRATQPWVAFCDSDDLWEPDHLRTVDEARRRVPDVEAWFTNFVDFADEPGRPAYDRFANMPRDWWRTWSAEIDGDLRLMRTDCVLGFLVANPVFPSTLTACRERLLALGRPDPVVSRLQTEDADLTRRLVASARTGAIAHPTVKIRKHAGNFSANKLGNYVGKGAVLTRTLAEPGACFDGYVEAIRRARNAAFADALRQAIWSRSWGDVAEIYVRGVRRFAVPIEAKYAAVGAVAAAARRLALLARDRRVAGIFDRLGC